MAVKRGLCSTAEIETDIYIFLCWDKYSSSHMVCHSVIIIIVVIIVLILRAIAKQVGVNIFRVVTLAISLGHSNVFTYSRV